MHYNSKEKCFAPQRIPGPTEMLENRKFLLFNLTLRDQLENC